MADPVAFAHAAAQAGARVLSVTTTPAEYVELAARVAKESWGEAEGGPLRQALGLHPWWAPQDAGTLNAFLDDFDAQLPSTRFVGEVGLDFSARRAVTREGQLRAFAHIARGCAQTGGKVLSVHCVRAYDDTLDLLEGTGCAASCACVFHWFSGTSDQLQRAIKLGCWFSVGERVLATKRGRAYARAMPPNRVLLETDEPYVADPLAAPPSVACSYADVAASLSRAAALLAAARGIEADELANMLHVNGDALFG